MVSRKKAFAALRIAFGIVWGIDAIFKWNPTFLNGLGTTISSMSAGQPTIIVDWLNFWSRIISIDPHLFALAVAIIESVLAIALIINVFPKTMYLSGFFFSLIVWSVGEGFGGPYSAASTDIGTAIIYAFVFAALYFEKFGSDSITKNSA